MRLHPVSAGVSSNAPSTVPAPELLSLSLGLEERRPAQAHRDRPAVILAGWRTVQHHVKTEDLVVEVQHRDDGLQPHGCAESNSSPVHRPGCGDTSKYRASDLSHCCPRKLLVV